MNKVYHCFFEQSGTFKNEFKKLGYQAFDYDIKNDFEETDYIVDLFQEIESAYDNKESIFDFIKTTDMILAFFPCIRFEQQIIMHFKGEARGVRDLPLEKKMELDLKLHRELAYLYEKICQLVIVCIRKKLPLIIENPYRSDHYLVRYWALNYTLLDTDRTMNGDYYQKPTQYFFVNCKPKSNPIFEPLEYVEKRTISHCTGRDGLDKSVFRSMIHPQYANRFIREFILERGDKE